MQKTDRTFEAFKELVPYLRGALWWAQNDLIKDRHGEFNQNDEHVGHPLLSVSRRKVESRFDAVPLLVGTSGKTLDFVARAKCILVTGMTRSDPDHKTYFGTIIQPGLYSFEDMMTGVRPSQKHAEGYDRHTIERRDDERGIIRRDKWIHGRTMTPNWDKPMVAEAEMIRLNSWCREHHLGD